MGGGAPGGDGGASNAGAAGASASASGGTTSPTSDGGAPATGGDATAPTGLPKFCTDACNAAAPVNPSVTDYGALGNVTMYTELSSDGGACQYGSTGVMYFAAIDVNLEPNDGLGQWQEGRICGQCVEVTALTSEGAKQVVVRIMDKCADGYCGIDLGGNAPSDLMVDGFGRYEGAWRLVTCVGHPETYDGQPSLFVKDGSNGYWSAVQVRNPDTAVAAIEWQDLGDAGSQGTFSYASPSIENYYLVPTEVLQGNATYDLTVRYVDGTAATVSVTSGELAEPGATYPLD
jgi:expansin (peptidoglycan-binding protein)